METSNNINYSFIAVPTNLFFALDNNLRNALTVLLQLSSVFADSDGYFFRTNEDLQSDFKMGKNLTIAVLESLYQYGLLQVKSVGFTRKNSRRQVNFFRVNVERFKDFEKFHIYTITKNEELHLETVDYKAKGFKVTYTTSTSTVEGSILNPTDAQKTISEETPIHDTENVTEPKETANNDTVEVDTPTEDVTGSQEEPTDFDEEEDDTKELNDTDLESRLIRYYNDNQDSVTNEKQYNEFETVYNMVLQNYKDNGQITFEQYNHARLFVVQPRLSALRYKINKAGEVETRSLQPSKVATLTTTRVEENNATEEKKIEKEEKQKELQQKLVVNVDGQKVETASAIPTNVEKRYICDTRPTNKLDATVLEKCKELVKRYKEMEIPSSNQSLELCNKACAYFTKQYKDGFIDLEDKDHFVRELVQARFEKHRI